MVFFVCGEIMFVNGNIFVLCVLLNCGVIIIELN